MKLLSTLVAATAVLATVGTASATSFEDRLTNAVNSHSAAEVQLVLDSALALGTDRLQELINNGNLFVLSGPGQLEFTNLTIYDEWDNHAVEAQNQFLSSAYGVELWTNYTSTYYWLEIDSYSTFGNYDSLIDGQGYTVVDSIIDLAENAFDEGFDQGYAAGFVEGFESGYARGYIDGVLDTKAYYGIE